MEAKKAKPAAKKPAKKLSAAKKPAPKVEFKAARKATVLSFRRGRHTQNTRQFILDVPRCKTKTQAARYIGKKVIWTSPGKKEIVGKITAPHGNSGAVRARFSKGLPGTAITQKVKIK